MTLIFDLGVTLLMLCRHSNDLDLWDFHDIMTLHLFMRLMFEMTALLFYYVLYKLCVLLVCMANNDFVLSMTLTPLPLILCDQTKIYGLLVWNHINGSDATALT